MMMNAFLDKTHSMCYHRCVTTTDHLIHPTAQYIVHWPIWTCNGTTHNDIDYDNTYDAYGFTQKSSTTTTHPHECLQWPQEKKLKNWYIQEYTTGTTFEQNNLKKRVYEEVSDIDIQWWISTAKYSTITQ